MNIKNIIKSTTAISLAVVMIGCFAGCSGTPSAKLLSTETKANMEKVKSVNVKLNGDIDMSFSFGGETQPFKTSMELEGITSFNPTISHLSGSIPSLLGSSDSSGKYETYSMVGEDGQVTTYTNSNSIWTKGVSSTSSSDPWTMVSALFNSSCEYEIKDGKKIDNKDTYLLSTNVTGQDLATILSSAGASSGMGAVASGASEETLKGLSVPVNLYVYKDSKLPASVDMDLGPVFQKVMTAFANSLINAQNSGSENETTVAPTEAENASNQKLLITLTFSKYDESDAVVIPESVIEKAESKQDMVIN